MAVFEMNSLSDTTKVALFKHNVTERKNNSRHEALVVQEYSFLMTHNVDKNLVSQGSESPIKLSVKVRVGAGNEMRHFYECIGQTFPSVFTMVFNAVYDEHNNLKDYDGAMVFSGYVLGLDELTSRDPSRKGNTKMSLVVKILVGHIAYIGENGKKVSHTF